MAPIAMEVLQLTCPDGIFAGMMVSFSCARTVFQVFFLVFAILDGNRYFPVEERQEDSGHLATSTTMLCP